MEIAKPEVQALQEAVNQSAQEKAQELLELHLTLTAAIAGEPVFG
jgi:hypothetical protein